MEKEEDNKVIKDANELFNLIETVTKVPSGGSFLNIGRGNQELNINLTRNEFLKFYKKLAKHPNSKKNTLEFLKCNFKSAFYLNSEYRQSNLPHLSFNFNHCTLEGITLSESIFDGKLKFRKCSFKRSLYVYNTTFLGYVEFFDCDFEKRVRFIKSKFEETVVFTKSKFHKNTFFTYTRFKDIGIFNRSFFVDGIDLSQAIIEKELSFNNVRLNNFRSLNINEGDEKFEETIHDGDIPTINKKETFRIVKKQLIKSEDKLGSVRYDYLERLSYQQYLNEIGKKWYQEDMLIFQLNRFSNLHKHSFLQGVFFTVLILVISHSISLLTSGNFELTDHNYLENLENNFKGLIISLNPAHSIKSLKEIYGVTDFGGWFYFFDYLGRIFISYGIYQTVQAFRKFK